jgi:hypothetical protein
MLIQIRQSAHFLLLVTFLVCSCKKESTTAPEALQSTPLYLNSFESSADTVGWQGFGTHTFYADAPRGGGKQSLYVSGGCQIPHAYICFQNSVPSSYVKLHCWGKRLIGGGSVSLTIMHKPLKSIYCQITDSVWTYYESTDSLFCASDDSLSLELDSGGIVAGSMLVDMIEVIKVN